MHNRQGLTLKLVWASLLDYDLWPLYAISWTLLIPVSPVSAYLTLNLRHLGFDTFETNLLTIPAYVLFLIQLLFWVWFSEKINNRMAIVLFYSFWCFPLLLALELLPSSASSWSWYAITALLIGYPYVHSINGECSWNFQFEHPCPNTNFCAYSQSDIPKCRVGPHEDLRQCNIQYDLSSKHDYCI